MRERMDREIYAVAFTIIQSSDLFPNVKWLISITLKSPLHHRPVLHQRKEWRRRPKMMTQTYLMIPHHPHSHPIQYPCLFGLQLHFLFSVYYSRTLQRKHDFFFSIDSFFF